MPLVHEFGIISDINDRNLYSSYSPEPNGCITVHDDTIQKLMESLSIMKTYFHSLDRQEFGLSYYGITIIPPESLTLFLDIVLSNKVLCLSDEVSALCEKIHLASVQNKYMVHFGI